MKTVVIKYLAFNYFELRIMFESSPSPTQSHTNTTIFKTFIMAKERVYMDMFIYGTHF